MNYLFDKNWREDWLLTLPPLEIVVRGTLVYLILFALLRFVFKRQVGTLGIADLLVVVLIGDAAQNAMASECKSLSDGLVLVITILFWAYALDWLGYRFPRVQRLLHPSPLPLVRDGRMLRHNMRRELISFDELMSQIREQGVSDLSKVRLACMEGDGRISIVLKEERDRPSGSPERGEL